MRGDLGGNQNQGLTYTDSGQTSDHHTQMQQLWGQRETLSPDPRHCYGYQNDTCIRQHFHGSSRWTAVEVSGPETIFMVKVMIHRRYWHEVVIRPQDFDNFLLRGQQLLPRHKVYSWNFNQVARVSGHLIKSCGRYNICWSLYKTNRYTPVSLTHKLPPKYFCKNVPYSFALRLKRIFSDSDIF